MLVGMRFTLPLFVVLLLSLLPCRGQDEPKSASREEVDVGGRKIKLPAPVGFQRVDGLNAESDRMLESMLPASNRYLARFEAPKINTAEQGHSFNAQVLRNLETREIGDRTFGEMKQQTKAELDKVIENIRQEVAKISGKAEKAFQAATVADAALSVSDVAVLGYFDDSPKSLGFTMAMNVAAKADDKAIKEKIVVASMIVPVNGRLIYLYANADLKSEADRQWAEKAVMTWRDAVVAANPRVEGPPVSTSIFDDVGRSAVIGAIVGALGGLFAILFKKMKKS